jgi:murein DD-endopeptidase MepM/ murein hydrolase activator NlpD
MSSHILAPYWAVKHRRPADYNFFKALQPPVVKIMDGGRPDYEWVYSNLPSATAVMRDWLLDDNNGQVWKDCMAKPAETGKRVAQQMITKAQTLGIDKNKTLLMGPTNEPKVWEDGGLKAAALSSIAFCDELTAQGWRGLALNLSVGWPRNMGTDLPPRWDEFPGLEDAIKRGGHTLGLHEYWSETGVDKGWGWLAGRALKCPWQVPIIIGECGMSYAVTRSGIPTVDQGWQKHISDETYAAQIVDYHNRMAKDGRVKGLCLFLCDYANGEWWSKDVEPAYDNILARKSKLIQPATTFPNPTPVPIPNPTPDPTPVPTLAGKIVSEKPNDGTTYVYGQVPVGGVVYFAWRGQAAIAAIQSGPHAGYEGWKQGYYSIPLYRNGITPCAGIWDIWVAANGTTSKRVEFATDGKGGARNQIEVNFAFGQAPAPAPTPEPEAPMAHRYPLDTFLIKQFWGIPGGSFRREKGTLGEGSYLAHEGIDFRAAQGTPVKCCADGVVAHVGDFRTERPDIASGGYGLYIRVRHAGYDTVYCHLSKQNVKVGDNVKLGQVIGLVGSTGNSTGAHLHWEVRLTKNGVYDKVPGSIYNACVDPIIFFAGLDR